jgi:Flp pilus assembly protein TadG
MSARQVSAVRRDGAIAVELAVLLPLVMFLAVIGVDYARIFSRTLILQTASRNGCFYAAIDSAHAADTAGITAVTMNDLTDTSPTPTVIITHYTGTDGWAYVQVTVQQTFTTVTSFPGVPDTSTLSQMTEMRVCPSTPKPGTYANY